MIRNPQVHSCRIAVFLMFFPSAVLAIPPLVAVGPTLLGSNLYDIDPITGTAQNPRISTDERLVGVAYASDGLLYGISGPASSATTGSGRLFTVDVESGIATRVGFDEYGDTTGGLTVNPLTKKLFAIAQIRPGTSTGFGLLAIDLQTGSSSITSSFASLSERPSALAFDDIGRLYVLATGSDELWRVDPETGSRLSSVALSAPIEGDAGMDFESESGMMFVATGSLDGHAGTLSTLNPMDGFLSMIGETGAPDDLSGLAFLPEPSSITSFLGAALFLMGSSVRKPRRLLAASEV